MAMACMVALFRVICSTADLVRNNVLFNAWILFVFCRYLIPSPPPPFHQGCLIHQKMTSAWKGIASSSTTTELIRVLITQSLWMSTRWKVRVCLSRLSIPYFHFILAIFYANITWCYYFGLIVLFKAGDRGRSVTQSTAGWRRTLAAPIVSLPLCLHAHATRTDGACNYCIAFYIWNPGLIEN